MKSCAASNPLVGATHRVEARASPLNIDVLSIAFRSV